MNSTSITSIVIQQSAHALPISLTQPTKSADWNLNIDSWDIRVSRHNVSSLLSSFTREDDGGEMMDKILNTVKLADRAWGNMASGLNYREEQVAANAIEGFLSELVADVVERRSTMTRDIISVEKDLEKELNGYFELEDIPF